jgi:hypothetical protein
MSLRFRINKALQKLTVNGYFADVFAHDADSVSIDCSVYMTPFDKVFTSPVLHASPSICTFCPHAQTDNQKYSSTVMCPVCGDFTMPRTVKVNNYRIQFKIDGATVTEAGWRVPPLGDWLTPVPPEVISILLGAVKTGLSYKIDPGASP